jgi:hypothetical protein
MRDHVENLAGRYCAAVLSGDPAEFGACWAEDAEWIGPAGHVFAGRERITRVFEKARLPFRLCVQELLSGVVEPVGEEHAAARAVWQIRELQWRTDDSRTFVIGTYADECAAGDDGIWRFTRRQFTESIRGTF